MGVEKMSGIYIPSAKIPDGNYVRVLMLHKDGTCIDGIGNVFKVVPVPPHGRCIDADKLMQEMRLFIKENMLSRDDARELLETIADAPTVIEAEEG